MALFQSVNALPNEFSWLKIACVKWAYVQDPKHGFCPHPDEKRIRNLHPDICRQAEACLKILRLDHIDVVKALHEEAQTVVLGTLDRIVADSVLTNPKGTHSTLADRSSALQAAVAETLVKTFAMEMKMPQFGELSLPSFFEAGCLEAEAAKWAAQSDPAALAVAGTKKIHAKLIGYNEQFEPMSQQDFVVADDTVATADIDFVAWATSQLVVDRQNLNLARSAAHKVLMEVHFNCLRQIKHKVRMTKTGTNVQVFANFELGPGALKVPVPALNVSDLVDKASHHHAVAVTYAAGMHPIPNCIVVPQKFFVSPHVSFPKMHKDGTLEWSGKETPLLFWTIRRSHKAEEVNCELVTQELRMVDALAWSATHFENSFAFTSTDFVEFAVLTNTTKIAKDEEIVLQWAEQPKQQKQKKTLDYKTTVLEIQRADKRAKKD
jgi:hypothetical protein